MKEYMVLSYFDLRVPYYWKEHFFGTEKECELYCKKYSLNSLAEWYIYPKGEYPIGYYRERGLEKKDYRCFIRGKERGTSSIG